MKINRIRSPAKLGDAVPVLLAMGFARVLGLQAAEPAPLIIRVENPAANQCLDPSGEIVPGGNDTSSGRGVGMIHVRIMLRQQWASSCRSLNLGRIRRFAH